MAPILTMRIWSCPVPHTCERKTWKLPETAPMTYVGGKLCGAHFGTTGSPASTGVSSLTYRSWRVDRARASRRMRAPSAVICTVSSPAEHTSAERMAATTMTASAAESMT